MPNNLITSQLFRNATIVSDNAKTPSYSVSDQCEKIPSLVPIPRTWRKCPHRRHYHVDNIISTPGITKTSRKIPSSMNQDTLLCFAKPWGPEEENVFITRGMSKVYTHPSFCHEVFDSNNNKARLDRTRRRVIQSRDVSPRQPMRTTPKTIDVALNYLAHDLNMYENSMTEVRTGIPQLRWYNYWVAIKSNQNYFGYILKIRKTKINVRRQSSENKAILSFVWNSFMMIHDDIY